jgi:hypothetical protein
MNSAGRTVDRAQQLQALERANRVRTARAHLKRRIAAGELTAAEVILSSRWEVVRMPIGELLISQRHWGESRSCAFLARLGLREHKTIGSMTARQRIALAAVLTRGQAVSGFPDHVSLCGPAVETVPPMG